MKALSGKIFAALSLLTFGFVAGALFQKYYTVDRLLRDIGVRTELSYQLDGRKSVSAVDAVGPKTMVAIAFGQSNSANYGNLRHESKEKVYNFYAGRLYPARDPMIGAQGMGGSVWTRLGDRLIDGSVFDATVFATIGVGSADIARWAPGGDLHSKLLEVIKDIRQSQLVVTHLLWHQGEADARLGTNPREYQRLFHAMLGSIREHGVDSDIFVSVTTRCYDNPSSEPLRTAQRQLVDPKSGILAGPDTDVLGPEYRYDDCHFSGRGLNAAAELWFDALIKAQVK